MKLFDSPHVLIFANFPPDFAQLSLDRWVLVDLSGVGCCRFVSTPQARPPRVPGKQQEKQERRQPTSDGERRLARPGRDGKGQPSPVVLLQYD